MAIGEVISSGIAAEFSFGIDRVVCLERRKVRVIFTVQPKALFAGGSDDALNLSNWTIVPRPDSVFPEGNPAYTTVVVTGASIVREDPLAIDVSVDLDFSFDLLYEITINAAVISAENVGGWSLDGVKTALFVPYDPSCRQKPVASVFSWFGRAAKKYDFSGDTELFMGLLQDLLEQTKSLIDCFPEQFDALYCREDFLDSRMRSLGNPFEFFTSEMTVNEKRRVALQLIDIYRLKGTSAGIQVAIQNILGISGVMVLSWNENTWRIGESFEQLGIPFDGVLPNGVVQEPFLGGGLYVPTGGPPGYPTEPIDPVAPDNFQYTGTAFLGSEPLYTQAYLSGGYPVEDSKKIAKIGQWHLAASNNVPYAINPAFHFMADPSAETEADIGITVEPGRAALYAYRIILPSTFTPTAVDLQRVITLAKYMQPANMHLNAIGGESGAYDPLVLGVSWLGVDWILHG